MPLQDLTPQLRTRLNRMERIVGWFVLLAAGLLLSGFLYYGYHTAQRKGWFVTKAPYFTFVETATGLNEGDPVKLMGFDVGEITKIEAMPADDPQFNVYIEFEIRAPYYGYLWTDSKVLVGSGDFLGNRFLEVTKGISGRPSYKAEEGELVAIYQAGRYEPMTPATKPFWLLSLESPAITDRFGAIATVLEDAFPNILSLTNDVSQVLSNSSRLVLSMETTLGDVDPILYNLEFISEQLTNRQGSLGEWLLPTNLQANLEATLANARTTLNGTRTNLDMVVSNLIPSLGHLSSLTSNLNWQVESNTNILAEISEVVRHADEMVQGLKRHWLLRSAFEEKEEDKATGSQRPVSPLKRGKRRPGR